MQCALENIQHIELLDHFRILILLAISSLSELSTHGRKRPLHSSRLSKARRSDALWRCTAYRLATTRHIGFCAPFDHVSVYMRGLEQGGGPYLQVRQPVRDLVCDFRAISLTLPNRKGIVCFLSPDIAMWLADFASRFSPELQLAI